MDNRTPRRRSDDSRAPARRTPPKKRRRRTRAAKLAYARAALVFLLVIGALVGSVYGFTRLATADADDRPTGSSSSQAASQPAGGKDDASSDGEDAPDAIASSTVQVLEGEALKTLLTARIDELAAVTPPPTAPEGSGAQGGQGGESLTAPSTPTPPPPVSEKFDPASVGGTGHGNIAGWKAKNSDVVGWLRVPGTNINYPVVVGPDNLYYSQKGYDKNYSYNGVIWADSDTKFGSRSQISQNNVLYGHNWTNYTANPYITRASDVMFGQLTSFHHLSFAKRTPYIHYSTESEAMTWKVFAVFYTEESFNYIVSDPGAQGLQYIINEAKARSLHDYDVDVNSSDKILTLSTCTRAFGATSQQRFVVMARLMRPGESITEVDIVANPDYKRPQL